MSCRVKGGDAMSEELKAAIERAAAVLKAAGAREVYLFGSAATDTMREDSDGDFAVSGLPDEVFFHAMGQAGDVLRRRMDLIDLDDDTPFTRCLKEEGALVRVA